MQKYDNEQIYKKNSPPAEGRGAIFIRGVKIYSKSIRAIFRDESVNATING
jgi:hypothetical protein